MQLNRDTLKFNQVLVIGNGFDLDLGLPTSYSSFLTSPWFDDLKSQNNQLAHHLSRQQLIQGWVDVEQELAKFSKSTGQKSKVFQKEYDALQSALRDYIKNLEYESLNYGSRAAEILDDFLDSQESLCIINFNYTETVEYFLKPEHTFSKHGIPKVTHIRVHGTAKANNIVFGVQDDADIRPQDVFLRKATAKGLFKDKLVGQIMLDAKKSIIFGHSLGESDHTQFGRFFAGNVKKQSIEIHYHSSESYFDLYRQMEKMTENQLQIFQAENQLTMIGPEKRQ